MISWEIGTHMQTLLEYDYPSLTPFDVNSMPPPSSPLANPVIWLAESIVANKSDGSLQLMPDGSSADPASTGGGVILANLTRPSGQSDVTNAQLAMAATEQLEALLLHTPRTSDGAISHRTNQVELWCVRLASPSTIIPLISRRIYRSDFVCQYILPLHLEDTEC